MWPVTQCVTTQVWWLLYLIQLIPLYSIWSYCHTDRAADRLLHTHSLVVVGLSVGYETWPPIGWQHPFVIGWSKYRLGLPSAPLRYGLIWPVGIPTVFQTPVTVPLHSPNGRQMPAIRAVQWDWKSQSCRDGGPGFIFKDILTYWTLGNAAVILR